MTKVLNIISDTNIGGAGRAVLAYLKYRDKEKFDTEVVLPAGSMLKERIESLGVKVHEIDAMADKSYDRAAIKTLKALIREINPDIVHTHGSLSGRIAAKRCGKKIVYTRHTAFPISARMKRFPFRTINKLINEHYADRIIAISPATLENLKDAGLSPNIIDVMMNGVEAVPRKTASECAEIRQKLGVKDGEFTFGILARIEEYKGHSDVLRAAEILKANGRGFKLIFAGSGDYEETLKAEAKAKNLESDVIFLGFVEDVSAVLSVMDIQVNASYMTETSSLSLLEGMSMGIPAVVSDCSGNPWVITDGENGLLFPPRDSTALAAAIETLVDSPEKYEKMSARALELYREKFTGEISAGNIEKTYNRLMEVSKNG